MWFTENPWPPMLMTGLCAVVCFWVWNSDRRYLYIVLGLVFLGLSGGIYAVERAIVTDGERLQGDVALLCDEFRRRDSRTLDHFSESAADLKALCKSAMEIVEIRDDLRLTDFRTTFTNENSRASVHFRANATIAAMGFSGHHPFRCNLGFRKEGGVWKITDLERLDPIKGDKIEPMAQR